MKVTQSRPAVILTALVLASSALLSEDAQAARVSTSTPVAHMVPSERPGHDIPSMRTQTSRTYAYDGKYRTVISQESLNYRDKHGHWQPIQNRLSPMRSSVGGYRNMANRYTVDFPTHLGVKPIRIQAGASWVTFNPVGVPGLTSAGMASGSTDTFRFTDGAFGFQAQGDAVKENITLNDAAAPSRFSYALNASPGLSYRLTRNGGVRLVDAHGTTKFGLSPAFMTDAYGARSTKIHAGLSQTKGGARLTITADSAWLRSPTRQWPVVIDPTVELQITQNCNLASGSPLVGGCNTGQIETGHTSPSAGVNALIQYAIPDVVPSTAQVESAHLSLRDSDPTCLSGPVISVFQVTHSWTSAATWTTYDGTNAWGTPGGDMASSAAASAAMTAAGTWDAYPTALIQGWVNGTIANDGLALVNPNNASCPGVMSFDTSAATLTVTWGTNLGLMPWYTTAGWDLDDQMSADVNVVNGNLILSNSDLSLAGVGLPLEIGRYYNSLSSASGSIGSRWNLSISTSVRLTPYSDGSVMFCQESGACDAFLPNPASSGTFISPPGIDAALIQNSDGTYTLAFDQSQAKYQFNGSGYLTSIADRSGNTLSVNYDGSNNVTGVTDTLGRTTSFTYLGGLISEMTDPVSRTYQYGYT